MYAALRFLYPSLPADPYDPVPPEDDDEEVSMIDSSPRITVELAECEHPLYCGKCRQWNDGFDSEVRSSSVV